MNETLAIRACRVCGCTEADCSACVALTGAPCHWVEHDLCSACLVPRRIQRKRAKGWRMPAGAIYVGRPTRWGNPYRVGLAACSCRSAGECNHNSFRVETAEDAVAAYRAWAGLWIPTRGRGAELFALRDHHLACWCSLAAPCHADVLLEMANGAA